MEFDSVIWRRPKAIVKTFLLPQLHKKIIRLGYGVSNNLYKPGAREH